MGRVTGAKNYKKEALLSAVSEILPPGAYLWEQVKIVNNTLKSGQLTLVIKKNESKSEQ